MYITPQMNTNNLNALYWLYVTLVTLSSFIKVNINMIVLSLPNHSNWTHIYKSLIISYT